MCHPFTKVSWYLSCQITCDRLHQNHWSLSEPLSPRLGLGFQLFPPTFGPFLTDFTHTSNSIRPASSGIPESITGLGLWVCQGASPQSSLWHLHGGQRFNFITNLGPPSQRGWEASIYRYLLFADLTLLLFSSRRPVRTCTPGWVHCGWLVLVQVWLCWYLDN